MADLEQRGLDRLGADLPGLLALSDRKRDLVRQVLRRRLRSAGHAERAAFETHANAAVRESDPGLRTEIDALLN